MQDDFLRLLNGLGLDRELKLYLEIFKNTAKHKFAVVKIGSRSITTKIDLVAQDLAFLSKLGLTPVVIHACPAGYNGTLSDKLVNLINANGGAAMNASERVLTKDGSSVNLEELEGICTSDCIPVLSCLNVSSDLIAKELVDALEPKKFIMITEESGILDENGKIISHIDLKNDLEKLIETQIITGRMLEKIKTIKQLLQKHPTTVVEICSAENLLKELFTVRGSGTFIRSGAKFDVKNSFTQVETKKVKTLIENSFGKKLSPTYFETPIECIFVERKYNAVAIIRKIGKVYYLDKFAVAKKSQGNGLGDALWNLITSKYPNFIWRSSTTNTINNWYFKQCDGTQKRGKWIVYWKGLDEHQASDLIDQIAEIEPSMLS